MLEILTKIDEQSLVVIPASEPESTTLKPNSAYRKKNDFAGGALNPAFDQRVAAPLWNPRVRFPPAELGGIKDSYFHLSWCAVGAWAIASSLRSSQLQIGIYIICRKNQSLFLPAG
jgi:hypothetical protein